MNVNLPQPPTFSGEGSSIEEIARDYNAWKVQLKNWVKMVKASGVEMKAELEFYRKVASLTGDAALVVDGMKSGDEKVTWAEIISKLDEVYLGCINSQALIASLKNIKQAPNETVTQYAARFNQVHRRLINIGVSNRDVGAQWFIDGLVPSLRRKVNEKVLEDQPLTCYDKDDASGAVIQVTNIALAKEIAQSNRFRGDRNGGRFGDHYITKSRGDDYGDRSGNAKHQSWSGRRTSGETKPATAQVNSLAADFAAVLGVKSETIQQRMISKECLSCGATTHQIKACPKVRRAKMNHLASQSADDSDHEKNE